MKTPHNFRTRPSQVGPGQQDRSSHVLNAALRVLKDMLVRDATSRLFGRPMEDFEVLAYRAVPVAISPIFDYSS